MTTTELRASFKRIHSYQDWQRQCEALADEIDRLRGALKGAEIALARAELTRYRLSSFTASEAVRAENARLATANERLRTDAAFFRATLDALFHGMPLEANGTIILTPFIRETINALSAHTYKDGKAGPTEAREALARAHDDSHPQHADGGLRREQRGNMSHIVERLTAWDGVALFPTVIPEELRELQSELDHLRRDNERLLAECGELFENNGKLANGLGAENLRLRAALEPARTAFKNLSDYMQSQETRSGKFRTLWDELALALEHPAALANAQNWGT